MRKKREDDEGKAEFERIVLEVIGRHEHEGQGGKAEENERIGQHEQRDPANGRTGNADAQIGAMVDEMGDGAHWASGLLALGLPAGTAVSVAPKAFMER